MKLFSIIISASLLFLQGIICANGGELASKIASEANEVLATAHGSRSTSPVEFSDGFLLPLSLNRASSLHSIDSVFSLDSLKQSQTTVFSESEAHEALEKVKILVPEEVDDGLEINDFLKELAEERYEIAKRELNSALLKANLPLDGNTEEVMNEHLDVKQALKEVKDAKSRLSAELEVHRKEVKAGKARRIVELEVRRQAEIAAKQKAAEKARRDAELEVHRKAEAAAKQKAQLAAEKARRYAELKVRRKAEAAAKRKAQLAAKRASFKEDLKTAWDEAEHNLQDTLKRANIQVPEKGFEVYDVANSNKEVKQALEKVALTIRALNLERALTPAEVVYFKSYLQLELALVKEKLPVSIYLDDTIKVAETEHYRHLGVAQAYQKFREAETKLDVERTGAAGVASKRARLS